MTQKTKDKILSAIAKITHIDTHSVQFKDLGGLTNTNYKVRVHTTSYFVRVGNKYPDLFGTSTENDWQCTSIATSIGLSPKSFLHSPEDRIIISEFIDTKKREIDLCNPITSKRFLDLLRRLHSADIQFPQEFCPYTTIYMYAKHAMNNGVTLPSVLSDVVLPTINRLQNSHNPPITKKVPCHLDLHRENVLDDGQRFWLIDWEYAAMADPFFDLASIASTDNFTDGEMEQFIHTYLGRPPTEEELQHLFHMRILADARWSYFCYLHTKMTPSLESTYTNFAVDFLEQCVDRLQRL